MRKVGTSRSNDVVGTSLSNNVETMSLVSVLGAHFSQNLKVTGSC